MAITKQKKVELLEKYNKDLANSRAFFLTKYQGMSVNDLTSLRQKLREANGNYVIVKNTLAKKAFQDAGLTGLDKYLKGPVAVSFSFGDVPPVAKALVEFAKDADALEITSGVLEQKILGAEDIKNLADLPPLDVVRAQLLGVISAPASQLVGVVASGVRQVINVVNAYAEKETEVAEA